jgi:hypothetical protein
MAFIIALTPEVGGASIDGVLGFRLNSTKQTLVIPAILALYFGLYISYV